MYRIRMILPKRQSAAYRNLDLLHDALVNGLIAAGAAPEQVIGAGAGIWHFAALGWRNGNKNRVHTLVVGTADAVLAGHLQQLDPADIQKNRENLTGEKVDFSTAEIVEDLDPVGPGQNALGIVMLSPLAISRQKKNGKGPKWHSDLNTASLAEAVNYRLSRLADRNVDLMISPDRLYLRAHPKHDTLVQTKEMKNGRRAFVIGMRAPLVMQGSEEDLRLAWYAGIGEKNRNGFGCIGLAERGIGR